MIKQIGLPLRGRPILLITRMITDRIGLHSVLRQQAVPAALCYIICARRFSLVRVIIASILLYERFR